MAERVIPIEGPGVQPFWTAFTTAPAVPPSPSELDGMVVQNGAGPADGYAELISRANMSGTAPVVPFDTSLRVTTSSVPLISLNHGFDWFSCFHIRFGMSLVSAGSYADLKVTATDASTDANILVHFAPAASTVSFNGVVTDITELVSHALAPTANGVDTLIMDLVEFHVVARRRIQPSIGALAMFDIRLAFFYVGQLYEVYSVTRAMKTTQFFQSSFLCHVG